ncbi:hypothetical protein PYW08_010409 [Mythimna loreyi]|uniref:Uncharacterized protein n=1 Tax=Mythimna loreyi TaxID=667449 RepID=A0ACC2Q5P7_9NEOP|nr:hypothetical protein PYW08_010409 [Mythimna loreyi]
MLRRKDFFVFDMQPVKDDKQNPPQTTGTSEDGSSSTPVGTAPSSGPSTATAPSTTTGPPAVTSHFGISMVNGPPIVLNLSEVPSVTSDQSRATSCDPFAEGGVIAQAAASLTALASRSATLSSPRSRSTRSTAPGYTGRYGGYSGTTQSTMQRHAKNSKDSMGTSVFSLDREVEHYIRRRDSALYDFYPGTERTEYDYVAERTDMYNTNLLEATAHLIKGSLGVAVLSMHEAYMYGGLWTSLVVTVFIGVLVGYTMYMLIRSAQKMYRRLRINKLSYPDLAEAAAATAPWLWVRKKSKVFRHTVEIILFFQMCGICCIYHIVIAHTIRQIVNSFELDVSAFLFDIRMYILCTIPLLLPLCLIRSLKLLAPFAMVADIFVALCVFATIYFSISLALKVSLDQRAPWKHLHGFLRICGLSMYGTSGICVALPVENNMKKPAYFPLVVKLATTIVIILTASTGVFGYWAWGEKCRSPITVHMPHNAFTTVLQFLLVMMLSTTFAVNFWVPFNIVWHYVVKRHKKSRAPAWWERIYRFFTALFVMCTAMIAPHTIPVMLFLGQFFLGFLALVFPAFIEFFVDWEEQYASRARVRFYHNTKNFGLVILGLLLSASTFYSVLDPHVIIK